MALAGFTPLVVGTTGAALKVLVHVDPLTAPADLRLLTLDLPADFAIEAIWAA
jgi:hypothetical protein